MIESFLNFWHQLVEPSQDIDAEKRPLSRVLNGGLLILIFAGGIAQTEFMIRSNQMTVPDLIVIVAIIFFAAAYGLNRKGYFLSAVALVLSAFIIGIFTIQLLGRDSSENGTFILFYLIIPILIVEFFLSLRSYTVVAVLILGGILSLVSLGAARLDIFFFFLIFASLVGIASNNRRRIHRQRQSSLRESDRDIARSSQL